MEKKLPFDLKIQDINNFLGMFGCVALPFKELRSGETLEIYNELGTFVGALEQVIDDIEISINSPLGYLQARYTPGTASLSESSAESFWQGKVEYTITKNEKEFFVGTTYLDNARRFSSNFCRCHHTLSYLVDGVSLLNIVFQNHGKVFTLEMQNGDTKELVEFLPYDELNGYLRHDVKKGECAQGVYQSRNYACICPAGDDYPNLFRAFSHSYKNYENDAQEINKVHERAITQGDTYIKMGKAMQEIDPFMIDSITRVRDLLTGENGISLYDGLIKTSMISFSNEEVKALLGIDLDDPNRGVSLS